MTRWQGIWRATFDANWALTASNLTSLCLRAPVESPFQQLAIKFITLAVAYTKMQWTLALSTIDHQQDRAAKTETFFRQWHNDFPSLKLWTRPSNRSFVKRLTELWPWRTRITSWQWLLARIVSIRLHNLQLKGTITRSRQKIWLSSCQTMAWSGSVKTVAKCKETSMQKQSRKSWSSKVHSIGTTCLVRLIPKSWLAGSRS